MPVRATWAALFSHLGRPPAHRARSAVLGFMDPSKRLWPCAKRASLVVFRRRSALDQAQAVLFAHLAPSALLEARNVFLPGVWTTGRIITTLPPRWTRDAARTRARGCESAGAQVHSFRAAAWCTRPMAGSDTGTTTQRWLVALSCKSPATRPGLYKGWRPRARPTLRQ